MKHPLGISNFLEEISSLSILLFSSISFHCSLMKAFLSLRAVLYLVGYIRAEIMTSTLLPLKTNKHPHRHNESILIVP